MNTKQAFQKVKILTGCEPKPSLSAVTNPESFAKKLNSFYARFETQDFSTECEEWLRALPQLDPDEPAPFTEEDVQCQLSRCKPGKAPGPDGIPARVLKTCAWELSPIVHKLFCESYQSATIPTLWKTATIIPVPKKDRQSVIRKLYVVSHHLLLLYQSISQPILLNCSICFWNMLSVKNRTKLTRITNMVAKIIGLPTPNLSELNNKAIARIATTITQAPASVEDY